MSDFLAGDATPEEILRLIVFNDAPTVNGNGSQHEWRRRSIRAHALVCIPAGSPTPHAAELLGSRRFKAFIDEVSRPTTWWSSTAVPFLPVADTLEICRVSRAS